MGVFAVHPQKGPKMTLFWGSHGPQVAQNTLRRVEPSGLKPANLYSTKCRFFGHFWHIWDPPQIVRHSGDSDPHPHPPDPEPRPPSSPIKGGEIVYDRGPYDLPCGGNVLILNFYMFIVVYCLRNLRKLRGPLTSRMLRSSIFLTKRIVRM